MATRTETLVSLEEGTTRPCLNVKLLCKYLYFCQHFSNMVG